MTSDINKNTRFPILADDLTDARRQLPPVGDWLTGILLHYEGPIVQMHCRECDELLCTIEDDDALWILVDVARDHRQFCRDHEEREP